jgi:hypothetical protein
MPVEMPYGGLRDLASTCRGNQADPCGSPWNQGWQGFALPEAARVLKIIEKSEQN